MRQQLLIISIAALAMPAAAGRIQEAELIIQPPCYVVHDGKFIEEATLILNEDTVTLNNKIVFKSRPPLTPNFGIKEAEQLKTQIKAVLEKVKKKEISVQIAEALCDSIYKDGFGRFYNEIIISEDGEIELFDNTRKNGKAIGIYPYPGGGEYDALKKAENAFNSYCSFVNTRKGPRIMLIDVGLSIGGGRIDQAVKQITNLINNGPKVDGPIKDHTIQRLKEIWSKDDIEH